MKKLAFGSRDIFRAAMAIGLAGMLAIPALGAEGDPPADATPVSAWELLKIYGDKTWRWGEGGGHFAIEGRVFEARTIADDGGVTTATGTWLITDGGRLCFKATWKNESGSYPAESCFLHVESAGSIYQRVLPEGKWYVFRHAKPDSSDEFEKLERGNVLAKG